MTSIWCHIADGVETQDFASLRNTKKPRAGARGWNSNKKTTSQVLPVVECQANRNVLLVNRRTCTRQYRITAQDSGADASDKLNTKFCHQIAPPKRRMPPKNEWEYIMELGACQYLFLANVQEMAGCADY